MNLCKSVQQFCKKVCPTQKTPKNEENTKILSMSESTSDSGDYLNFKIKESSKNLMRTRSSSLTEMEFPQRKQRINSIFAITQPLKKSESFDSQVKNKNQLLPAPKKRRKNSRNQWVNKGATVYSTHTANLSNLNPSYYRATNPKRRQRTNSSFEDNGIHSRLKKSESCDTTLKINTIQLPALTSGRNYSDPVKNAWSNKGAMVYSAHTANPSKPKPSNYWVQTELQYVIVLPMNNPKRKAPPPPPKHEWEPKPLPEKAHLEREKEDFTDLDSDTSSDSFIPRSEAKPAPKPKGRFCCAKRQPSE